MKKIKISVLLLSGAILLGSCSTMNNTAKGGVIGGDRALLPVPLSVD